MKRILTPLNKLRAKKELFLFAIFLFSSTLIWFAGPAITLGEHSPLHSARRRLFTIGLLYAVLVIKYFLDRRLKTPQRSHHFANLTSRLMHSNKALIKLSNLSWFAVIGPSNSGKTALMNNSQISYIPASRVEPISINDITANGDCDWWLTQDTVLLDIPNNYLTATPDKRWLNLFTKKWRGKNTLSGIIVTLPLSDLTDPVIRDRLVMHLKNRIAELKAQFGNGLPFYFSITKCDLIPGFTDFFAHSGTDELGQAWGISLPAHTALVDTFINRFNALIQRLNKQLIWRLHQERGSYERVFIKDFPLQIERLKEMMVAVLCQLTENGNTFSLQGVYLTSAIQQSAPDITPERTLEATTPALQIMRVPTMPSRSYFIRQFLLQGLSTQYGRTLKRWQHRPLIYGVCASAITLTVVFLGYDIFYSKEKMLAMQDTVVSNFNIVIPQDQPQERQIGDLTVVS